MDILILINRFKYFFKPYRELFILLGTIFLVWIIVAIIIKKFVRKDERNGNYHIKDDE
ncbi:MAG: hypothetical protein WAW45_01290 [Atribacterota bacterium]